jgi:hypothetical protein
LKYIQNRRALVLLLDRSAPPMVVVLGELPQNTTPFLPPHNQLCSNEKKRPDFLENTS